MKLTSGEITLVVAGFAALPPTILAIRSLLEVRKVKAELSVPPKKAPIMATDPEDNLPLGEVVHEIRRDVFELGRMFGSHLMFHEPNVQVQDLYPEQERWQKPEQQEPPL